VEGARAAGLRAVWFNPGRRPRPAGSAPPDCEVTRMADLPRAVAALEGVRPPRAADAGRTGTV
jgi:FMN phosphatase YigB (HAD superfamily)